MNIIKMNLNCLEGGRKECDSEDDLFPPEDFDFDKFYRGRQFFRQNVFSCTLAMYFSLIIGLSIPNLLNALIFTRESDTSKKAFHRYLKTFQHVSLWHYDNVWDSQSEAHKSIHYVRQKHAKVRDQMQVYYPNFEDKFLSQYDMAIVQSGFVALIILYPEVVGIKCSFSDLDDYVYFWYGIGHLLGMKKQYNICAYGLSQAVTFCKEIEQNITQVYLVDPPKQFFVLMDAIIMAFNPFRKLTNLLTFPVILKLFSVTKYYKWLPFSLCDNLRLFIWKFLFFMMKSCNKFKFILNSRFESTFKLTFRN